MQKWKTKVIAALMVLVFALGTPGVKTQAQEVTNYNEETMSIVATGENLKNSYGVQPLTTMFDCEIILAFTTKGLEMTFTTSCVDVASVIGVKDIKVQQKMWYGWKTVYTSLGAENQNEEIFIASNIYPDAVDGKTYRVTCVHYADYDGYEEVENDTGAFKFIL